MAPKQRQLIKQDFEQALKKTQNPRFVFICWALETVQARKVIEKRLHPHHTLGQWLEAKTDIPFVELWCDEGLQKQRATRVLWLESLIKEFS